MSEPVWERLRAPDHELDPQDPLAQIRPRRPPLVPVPISVLAAFAALD